MTSTPAPFWSMPDARNRRPLDDRVHAGNGASMQNMIPTVFVVDADESVRAALESPLRRAGWKPELFASTGDFLACGTRLAPGCIMLDVSDAGAVSDIQRFAADRREIPVIAMSRTGDVALTVRAMRAGAVEFLTKPLAPDVVLAAVGSAIGESQAVLQQEAELLEMRTRHESLSPRETEVMGWVVTGALNKRIAASLRISEITVKAHRGRVMRKMRAASVADLVRMALKLGLSPVPPASNSPISTSDAGHRTAGSKSGSQPIRIMPARTAHHRSHVVRW